MISLIGTNYLAPRNVLYAWPMLALLVALGAGRRGAGRVTAAALVVGCAVSAAIVVAVPLTPALQRPDWRDLLAPLRSASVSRGVVALDGFDNTPVIEYYLPELRAPAPGARTREVDVITTRGAASRCQRRSPGCPRPASTSAAIWRCLARRAGTRRLAHSSATRRGVVRRPLTRRGCNREHLAIGVGCE